MGKSRHHPHCERTPDKRIYLSLKEANSAAIAMSGKCGKPMRTYPCGKHWHITSRVKRSR